MSASRPWTVLLFGGASGVGKTSVSHRLAGHFAVGITEADDFQVVLSHMTAPEQYPELHDWHLHPEEALRMSEDEHLAFAFRFAAIMYRALEHVIASHLETGTPIVLEGDFIHPSLEVQPDYAGVPAAGRVRAVFLYEPDEGQILRASTP